MARAASERERREHIGNVLRVAMLGTTPIIVAIALAKPLVLTILYSAAFQPAGEYLRWTLAGDYFKGCLDGAGDSDAGLWRYAGVSNRGWLDAGCIFLRRMADRKVARAGRSGGDRVFPFLRGQFRGVFGLRAQAPWISTSVAVVGKKRY